MTCVAEDGAPFGTGDIEHARSDGKAGTGVWVLVCCQTAALILQVIAVSVAWGGANHSGNVVSCTGLALTFASALWALTRQRLDRALRNVAVIGLGITTAVQWRMNDPLLFKGYDEQLHMRTLADIEASHSLFEPNPILAVSARYPALEALTALFHQMGLPLMAAATVVVLLARLALVLALCAAVEHLTGSPRAGGVAVAAYAISPQFVFFNSQFAYQTLSLPLALAAVAFIARARWAQNPTPLFCGATVCLLAVAVTHHLTSWITAAFLVVWAIAERHSRARRRIFCGAVVAVLAGAIWAAIQWSLLRDYFGPMIDDVTTQLNGSGHRELFTGTSTDVKPWWQRALLVYYAVAVSLAVSWLVFIRATPIIRRLQGRFPAVLFRGNRTALAEDLVGRHGGVADPDRNTYRWQPPLFLLAMVAVIPVLFAARVLPSFGEIGDRANSFVFLPFSLLIAGAAMRFQAGRHTSEGGANTKDAVRIKDIRSRCARFIRPTVVLLATGVFLGGYLLGSGSDWARLPGGYLPGADSRSMDAETLAAMHWAREGLPSGSRIGADRVNSTLLASEARVWPIMATVGPSMYREETWGEEQTGIARDLRLKYLYVDRRFADELPYVSGYFDEKSPPMKFTRVALTKFDSVPGIQEVYRHGPISIYDLGGLGISELRSGWLGKAPTMTVPAQVLLGILLGGCLALVGRSELGGRLAGIVRSIYAAAGPFLTYTFGLAALAITSIVLLLAHIWLGPAAFIAVALTVLAVNPQWVKQVVRTGAARFHWSSFLATGAVALAVTAAVTVAALEASSAHQLTSAGAPCPNGTCDDT
jgi:hypothetical protein